MKQFDFEQVGKRMPYTVPDGFFDKLEADVMEKARGQRNDVRRGSSNKNALRIAMCAVLAVAASVALFFLVQPLFSKSNVDGFESVELAFNNLSTDDQDFLIQVYEDEEILMNDFEFNP